MTLMPKFKHLIAGVPVQTTEEKILQLQGTLIKRAHLYFGKQYGTKGFNQEVACYIDNYLALEKFISGEEERRDMAWSLVQGSMGAEGERPDKKYKSEYFIDHSPRIKSKMVTLLDNHPDGWCFMRMLMNLEPMEQWTSHQFYEEVILKFEIDNIKNNKETHNQLVARVNMFDFIDKYLSVKYNITLEQFDI